MALYYTIMIKGNCNLDDTDLLQNLRESIPKQHSGAVNTGVPGERRSSSLSSYKSTNSC